MGHFFSKILFVRRCSSMVEHQPSKLNTWVRFPSPALNRTISYFIIYRARVAQLVEYDLAKVGVAGSSPVSRSFLKKAVFAAFFDFSHFSCVYAG